MKSNVILTILLTSMVLSVVASDDQRAVDPSRPVSPGPHRHFQYLTEQQSQDLQASGWQIRRSASERVAAAAAGTNNAANGNNVANGNNAAVIGNARRRLDFN